MKKIFFTILGLCSMISYAQDFTSGVKAGLNISTLGGDADVDSRTGFYFGFIGDWAISEKFHLQPEVLYSVEGGKTDDTDFGINYVKVPVLGKYKFNDEFSIQAGPYISVLTTTVEDGFDENLKSLDFGGALGLSYEFPSGLLIDARYNYGFNNISNLNNTINNSVIQVGLGYKFL